MITLASLTNKQLDILEMIVRYGYYRTHKGFQHIAGQTRRMIRFSFVEPLHRMGLVTATRQLDNRSLLVLTRDGWRIYQQIKASHDKTPRKLIDQATKQYLLDV